MKNLISKLTDYAMNNFKGGCIPDCRLNDYEKLKYLRSVFINNLVKYNNLIDMTKPNTRKYDNYIIKKQDILKFLCEIDKYLKTVKNDEQLLSVRSIVNNTLLDFTILEVITNKGIYNVTLNYKPVVTDKYGIIYKYTNSLEDWLQAHNIKTDIYDFSNNIDLVQRDEHNPLKCFTINIYNCI